MTGGNESDNYQSQLKRNNNIMNKSKRCCLGLGFGSTENKTLRRELNLKTLRRELNLTRWQYCEPFFASSAKVRSDYKNSHACGAKNKRKANGEG